MPTVLCFALFLLLAGAARAQASLPLAELGIPVLPEFASAKGWSF